ncbi:hypothetical protein [Microcoleus sp. CAWBG58]|uniref:hypothetical protein n=1 Tax=Microcoleus sp. CAWBG58 TaxID=2841651 RepID=UPI0025E2B259|nr:hypothetical protein [Microcoleus sp. CAWBG58]
MTMKIAIIPDGWSTPKGWIGGFADSNPKFAYPTPDLSSLPMLDNMANIERIKRQQRVHWPEFSWETVKGKPDSRCFQEFAPNISSIGYDDAGRIWSIICPQQGACIDGMFCLNLEVTVTGQRGWVDEKNRELGIAADMTVEGKIWFSPDSQKNWFVKKAWDMFEKKSLPFPSSKAHAIQVSTHKAGNPDQATFSILAGESSRFKAPGFARHSGMAWSVAHIDVEIGDIVPTNHPTVDNFNRGIVDLFNIISGNMLQAGNILTWNLWFHPPELVDTEEWKTHAERWRQSIDVEHGHESEPAKHADGNLFKPSKNLLQLLQEIHDLEQIIESLIWSD